MKKKKLWKAISAALSAVLLATSVPSAAFAAVPAKAADVQTKAADENELKLWYDEKAPDSYDDGKNGPFRLETAASVPACSVALPRSVSS